MRLGANERSRTRCIVLCSQDSWTVWLALEGRVMAECTSLWGWLCLLWRMAGISMVSRTLASCCRDQGCYVTVLFNKQIFIEEFTTSQEQLFWKHTTGIALLFCCLSSILRVKEAKHSTNAFLGVTKGLFYFLLIIVGVQFTISHYTVVMFTLTKAFLWFWVRNLEPCVY